MQHNNDRRAFFARVCIVSSFIISLVAIPTSASAAACTLAYSMTPNASAIGSGDTITYSVAVRNIGGGMCRDVSYSIYYGPNESFVSARPSPRASNYYWFVGNLGAGKRAVATVTTRHDPSVAGTAVNSEGCATARNVADSCGTSTVRIGAAVTAPSEITTTTTTQSTTTTQTGTYSTTTQPVTTVTVPTTQSPTTISDTTQSIATTTMNLTSLPKGREKGIWVWNFPSQMNTSAGFAQLEQLASYGMNAIYITIDDYLDIASLPEGATKNAKKAAYFANLAKVVQKANSLGMVVDVEGGWKDWTYPSNRWKGFALIDAAKEYNAAYPNLKIRALQYDVEPYILPEYETNKERVLTEFVEFIDQSANRLVGSDVKFSMAIPHFYDSAQAWTPMVTYGGKTTHTFTHLLQILEKKPGSMILLMSYRDFFDGANGTKSISEVEIREASAGGYSTLVIVGQETGNVDPAFVTFYGSTKTVVLNMLSTISASFEPYSNYGGTATHYMDSFLAMPR